MVKETVGLLSTSAACYGFGVWLLTAPDHTGLVPGQKWLIISLQQLLRVKLRHNVEPLVLVLQLNKQETLTRSITNSSRASIEFIHLVNCR